MPRHGDATQRNATKRNVSRTHESRTEDSVSSVPLNTIMERLRENLYSLCAASLRTIYILSRCYVFFGAARIKVPQFRTERFRRISDSQVERVRIQVGVKVFELKLVLVS